MVKMVNKKILAIGAHPDDIEYYAGGTLLKLGQSNQLVYVVVTNGEMGGKALIRRREQRKAAEIVGARELIFLDYPDSDLEIKGRGLRRDLLKVILEIRPDVVLSFDPEKQFKIHPDFHPDHRFLATIVIDLILIYSTLEAYIRKLGLTMKPLRRKPEVWLFDPERANYFEDIAHLREKKMEVLKVFKSQPLDLSAINGSMAGDYELFHRINFCSKLILSNLREI